MSPAALLLGLFAASLILALVREGRGGAARWMRAKFLGQVS